MNNEISENGKGNEGRWLLYGANGYTGRIIAEEAVRRGLRPVLAGRNRDALIVLAEQLNCAYRVFNLDAPESAAAALQDISVVMHCAGPFSATAQHMAEACIASGTHYMDITGEIPVLEFLYTLHERACSAGIAMIPGSGFDVVPTDCIALHLKEVMPDAVRLRLAFAGKLAKSPGTWRATLQAIPRCGAVRRGGELVTVPHAWRSERIQFDDKLRSAMTLPWGDLSSAWRSTGIPDIEVYGGTSKFSIILMQIIREFVCWLTAKPWVLQKLDSMLVKTVRGPDEAHRKTETYHLRGDVWNNRGEHASRLMEIPEGYSCTVHTSLGILPALLEGRIPFGVWTPSQAMGSGFAESLPGFTVFQDPGE
ncbi:MAG: saccharopine dehydrogenase NADP-binding domain-containing protein [Bacteroidota bacterium]